MKKRVYIETTIPSYLTARPTIDLLRTARQQLTREWWDTQRERYELLVSQLVVDECARGDDQAAARRLALVENLSRVEVTETSIRLAATLLAKNAVPEAGADDALHIATAAVHEMDFLLTWNCTHIANAARADAIRSVLESEGFRCPVICTPEELLGEPA